MLEKGADDGADGSVYAKSGAIERTEGFKVAPIEAELDGFEGFAF